MKKSNLKFSAPFIKKIEYIFYPEFKNNADSEISITNKFSVAIKKLSKDKAVVDLCLTVGDKSKDKSPFYINMIISAHFKWDDSYDEKTIQDLLTLNAPALLLGYARPIVSTITGMSPYPAYNLPFYNFTE